jgi:hypothetical protein
MLMNVLWLRNLPAQDKFDIVTIRTTPPKSDGAWTSTPATQFEGRVQSFTAERLVLVGKDGQERALDSDQIERVDVAWTNPAIIDALKLFEERRYQEATIALNAARDAAGWQTQILVGKMVQAKVAMGDIPTAGNIFKALANSLPPSMLYADMPLCWASKEPDRVLFKQAQEWLQAQSDAEKLMGASWLLMSDELDKAKRTLVQLQSSSNPTLAKLAVAQSWRTVSPPETMHELSQWQEFRDQLLEPLQLGPTEFIADRLLRIGETELALGQWMRIATIHADRYHRAQVAMENAAARLTRLGREQEANRLQDWIKQVDGKR